MPRRRYHSHVHDLLDALREPGCPVCTLVRRSAWRYLDALGYESVNDIGVRTRIRAARGFCNRHAWAFLEEHREALGTAIIARDIIRTLSREMAGAGRRAADVLLPRGPCPACAAEQASTANVLETLAEMLADAEVVAAYRRSAGVCVPHLLQGTSVRRTGDRRRLLAIVVEGWADTTGQLAGETLVRRAVGEAGVFGKDVATLDARTGGANSDRELPVPCASGVACVVCHAVRDDGEQGVVPEEADDATGSLCAGHAWLPWGRRQSSLLRRQIEAARTVANAIAAEQRSPLVAPLQALGLRSAAPEAHRSPCVACARQRRIEEQVARVAEAPLCLPHLRRAFTLENRAAWSATRARWVDLEWLLSEHIRKHDYRFRDEPRGEEQESPWLATTALVGERGVR